MIKLWWKRLCCAHDWDAAQVEKHTVRDPFLDLGTIGYSQTCPKCGKTRCWWKPYP